MRIPYRGCVGFRPEVMNVPCATQSRSNQVIDLKVCPARIHDSVLLKNLLTQLRWNFANDFLMGHGANIGDRDLARGSRRKLSVWNHPALDGNSRRARHAQARVP